MKTVGLTGGIASGKSTVAALLRARGLPVLDADQVARAVVAPGSEGLAQVARRFGPSVLQADGALDRERLRVIVLADPAERAALEQITHPLIRAAIHRWLTEQAEAGAQVAVVEAALMVETGSWRLYDALLVVIAAVEVQQDRLMRRNHLDAEAARRWIAAQLPAADKAALATAVVENSGDEAALARALDLAWARILQATPPA